MAGDALSIAIPNAPKRVWVGSGFRGLRFRGLGFRV